MPFDEIRSVSTATNVFLCVIVGVLLAVSIGAVEINQRPDDLVSRIDSELRSVFPGAHSWFFEDGDSPHFRGYTKDAEESSPRLVGLAFVTTDISPTKGYNGPIPILVGMSLNGKITDVLLFYHEEPFGYFSIDLPKFTAQFKDKSIFDPIKIGENVDAISRATMTLEAASRGIRVGARQVIRALLNEG